MRKEMQDQLWPTVTEASPLPKGANVFQGRGQQCTPAYACLNEAIDFQNTIGKDKIEDRILALSTYLKEKITENWGEDKLFTPMDEELSSGLVAFNPFDDPFDTDKKTSEVRSELESKNIIVRGTTFKDKKSDAEKTRTIRVSTHIFNNYNEIDKLISTMKTIIANLCKPR